MNREDINTIVKEWLATRVELVMDNPRPLTNDTFTNGAMNLADDIEGILTDVFLSDTDGVLKGMLKDTSITKTKKHGN